jgi:hypothetical protein
MEIQSVYRDSEGNELVNLAKTHRPAPKRSGGEIEVTIRGGDGARSWVMTIGEAVAIKQQIARTLWHINNSGVLPKKTTPNKCEQMDEG